MKYNNLEIKIKDYDLEIINNKKENERMRSGLEILATSHDNLNEIHNLLKNKYDKLK